MADERFTIAVASRADAQLVEGVERLIQQLSSSAAPVSLGIEGLRAILESASTTLLIARASDQSIVGMLTLVVFKIPTGVRAWIEDVVVHTPFRGRGAGEELTKRALDLAISKGARTIELTSRPERAAANKLYRKLGFERRNTNVYRYTPP
jgi:ribosomal protein S18 acetylase RimI-like enzyme